MRPLPNLCVFLGAFSPIIHNDIFLVDVILPIVHYDTIEKAYFGKRRSEFRHLKTESFHITVDGEIRDFVSASFPIVSVWTIGKNASTTTH